MPYFVRKITVPAILALFVFTATAQAQVGLDLGPLHIHTDGDGGTSVHIGRVIGVDTAPGEGSDVHVTRFINVDTTGDDADVRVGRRRVARAEDQTVWQAVDADVTAFLAEEAAKPEAKTLETLAAEYESSEAADLTEAFWLLNISLRAKNDAGIQNAVREMKKWADAGQKPELAELAGIYWYAVQQCEYPEIVGPLCENFLDLYLMPWAYSAREAMFEAEKFTREQQVDWIRGQLLKMRDAARGEVPDVTALCNYMLMANVWMVNGFPLKEAGDFTWMKEDKLAEKLDESLDLYCIAKGLAMYAGGYNPGRAPALEALGFKSVIPQAIKDAHLLAVDFYRKALEIPLTEDEVKILGSKSSVALTPEQIRKDYHVRVLESIAECYRLAGDADAAAKVTQEAADFREKTGI